MSNEEAGAGQVTGERGAHSLSRVLSVQSRMSNLLAFGLMGILGLGSLTWYYAHALARQGQARDNAKVASSNRAQGDSALPSLGRIDSWTPPPDTPGEPPPQQAAAQVLAEAPLAPSPAVTVNGAPPAKSRAELALERKLSGAVYSSEAGLMPAPAGAGAAAAGVGSSEEAVDRREPASLAALLRPTAIGAVKAQVLPAQRLLLPKGSFIDCTLETAIDSTLPGMTTCVMATDAFGVDGKVVLLERGTKLIGETRGQVAQGAARIFVLWTLARTPGGVVVPLDSPGADELGRSGLPGDVNRHFWERFGAAMLVSVVDGAIQAAAQSSRSGNGNVVVNPSTSQDVLTEILKNTISIAPTVVKQNGDRIQVLVARDVDFRSVYELRSASGR